MPSKHEWLEAINKKKISMKQCALCDLTRITEEGPCEGCHSCNACIFSLYIPRRHQNRAKHEPCVQAMRQDLGPASYKNISSNYLEYDLGRVEKHKVEFLIPFVEALSEKNPFFETTNTAST